MNNDVERAVEAENHDLKKTLAEKEAFIKEFQAAVLRDQLTLKKTIEELTNENHALKAIRVELEEHIKKLNQANGNLLQSNKAIIGGVIMLVSMLGRGIDSDEGH